MLSLKKILSDEEHILLSLLNSKLKYLNTKFFLHKRRSQLKVVRPPFHNKNIVSLNVNDGKDFIADYEL